MQIDADHRVRSFREKPRDPDPIPGDPQHCLASMGIYVFNSHFLFEQLCRDATQPNSQHDFGRNIIPSVVGSHKVTAFPFHDKNTGRSHYWRDVGTIEAYFETSMDLVAVHPELNLYDQNWPIRTYMAAAPPPKFVFAQSETEPPRVGTALDSLVSPGCIVSGGRVERSILAPHVRINSYARVEDSILFDRVNVGRRARIRRAIIDKGVQIPEDAEVGYDHEADRARGFLVTESGITVIAKFDGFADEYAREA
jgi:glucose-1-phosphate adenylyltransferase